MSWLFNPHSKDKGDQMKRLTYPGDYCKDIAYCNNGCTTYCTKSCLSKKLWEKLKAYENTGLTPEEVEDLKHGNFEKLP